MIQLFGSRARGEARRNSDYDLLVYFQDGYTPSLFELGGLHHTLTEALGADVDVVPYRSSLPSAILKDAQTIFERRWPGATTRHSGRGRNGTTVLRPCIWGKISNRLRTADAVVRRVTIVGEAALKLSAETKRAIPDVEWTSIISMRHVLVHDYSDLDENILWRTIRHDLPELKKKLLGAVDFSRGIVILKK